MDPNNQQPQQTNNMNQPMPESNPLPPNDVVAPQPAPTPAPTLNFDGPVPAQPQIISPTTAPASAPSEPAPQAGIANTEVPTQTSANQPVQPDQPTQPFQPTAAPVAAQPVMGNPGMPSPAQTNTFNSSAPVGSVASGAPLTAAGSKKPKKRTVLVALAILLVLVLGGGYTFAFYIPSTPDGAYARAMNYSNRAYDKLVAYEAKQSKTKQSGLNVDGTFSLTAAGASGDGTFSSQSNGGNSTGKLSLDVVGQKFDANFRSIQPKGQDVPDLYLQVTGIKSILQGYGLSQYASLDGQWVAVDHTLLQSVASSATPMSASTSAPSQAQIQDALKRIGAVDKQYLFTTSKADGVLVKEKNLGKSTQDGRTVYGYQMGYNKDNLKKYTAAATKALDDSSLNAWLKKTDGGKSFGEVLDAGSINKQIDSAKSDYKFTMYVDTKTTLIRQVHFVDPSDPTNNYFNLGLNYTGGSNLPFAFEYHGKDGTGSGDAKLVATLNTDTNKFTFDFKLDASDSGSPVKISANITATPSNASVNVTAPTGAVPVTTLIQSLGLSDLLAGAGNDTGAGGLPTDTTSDFSLTQ